MNKYVVTDGEMYFVFLKKTFLKKDILDTWACYDKNQDFITEVVWSETDSKDLLKNKTLRILGDDEKAKLLLLKDGWNGIIV